MKVLVLIGGTNNPSNSALLAESFSDGLRTRGAQVDVVHVKDLQIAHFRMDCYNPDFPHEADFLRVKRLIEESDGLVIATPVWNFGVPAHLKNLIDRMGAFGLDSATHSKGTFKGKPFYLIFTGGAPMPAWTGLMQMTTSFVREGLRYFGGTPCGVHFEPKCTKGPGVFAVVVDQRPQSIASVKAQGERFGDIVRRYKETGQLPAEKKGFALLYKMGNAILKRL